jgi:hypothetical protein
LREAEKGGLLRHESIEGTRVSIRRMPVNGGANRHAGLSEAVGTAAENRGGGEAG